MASDILGIVRIVLEVAQALVEAFRTHGDALTEMRLKDILPASLLTSLQKAAADAQAAEKFGQD